MSGIAATLPRPVGPRQTLRNADIPEGDRNVYDGAPAWLALRVVAGSRRRVTKKYRQFLEARRFHALAIERKMNEPRREPDPRVAHLVAEADLETDFSGGVTRGQILVLQAYQGLRRELVKALFR
jgi:hypothetical protein